jgi:hypothetical protein
MNNAKIYIICLLAMFVAVGVSAQNSKEAISQETEMISSYADKIKQFEETIANRNESAENDSNKADWRIDSLKLSLAEKDSIIFYQKIIRDKLADDYNGIKSRLAALEIYEFLDRRDISVFIDSLKIFDDILSPCNQQHYLLIEKIHSVNDLLSKISHNISDENIKNVAGFVSDDEEKAKQFLFESAEKDLLSADRKMTEIDEMDLSVLSEEQQSFYRQILTDRYRTIYSKIYPQ